jgi:hypothetical protein
MTDPQDPLADLMKDLGPDPDTALTEAELNEIVGTNLAEEAAAPLPAAQGDEAPGEAEAPKKRGRPRKAQAEEPDEELPALDGEIVGVELSKQTLLEMEAGRAALRRTLTNLQKQSE